MEKKITVDGKEVKLKSHGAIPLLYKQQFGKSFFSEVRELQTSLDTDALYNIIWLFAKTANKDIPSTPIEWLTDFDEFPLEDVFPEVMDMIGRLMKSEKK